MSLSVKLDENMPADAKLVLSRAGCDTTTVLEQGMAGWQDSEVWSAVQSEHRLLVTADKGFADLRRYPPGAHAGVLLLRPDEHGIRPLLDLLARVLTDLPIDSLDSAVTVVTPRSIPTRRPPP